MVEHRPHPFVIDPPYGRMWKRSDHRYPARTAEAHQELVVLHALAGRASYLVDGAVHELREGSLLWALSGQRHVLLNETAKFDMRVVLISARVFAPGLDMPPLQIEQSDRSLEPRLISPAGRRELEDIAQAQIGCTGPEAQTAGLRWWLVRAWSLWRHAPERRGQVLHPAVARAAQLWQEDPTRDLGDVAAEVGLSSGRLGRLFREQIGQGATRYRAEQKLARFEDISLAHPHLTLTTRALDAGFGSYAQFFRAYRKMHGRSPRSA